MLHASRQQQQAAGHDFSKALRGGTGIQLRPLLQGAPCLREVVASSLLLPAGTQHPPAGSVDLADPARLAEALSQQGAQRGLQGSAARLPQADMQPPKDSAVVLAQLGLVAPHSSCGSDQAAAAAGRQQ